MRNSVRRLFTEKKPGFDIEAAALRNELTEALKISDIGLRVLNRYDISGVSDADWPKVLNTVLSEPPCDIYYEEALPPPLPPAFILNVEPLPGQFDQKAASCEECIQMLLGGARPAVKAARTYIFTNISESALDRVKKYLINPIENRIAQSEKPVALTESFSPATDTVPEIKGFVKMSERELGALCSDMGFALPLPDMSFIQSYFQGENRDPTETELRVLDTYWSDHCRHTTFNTVLENVEISDVRAKRAFGLFLSVNGDRPVTLMNVATAAARYFEKRGELPMLDISTENNACCIRVDAEFETGREDWLVFFKNETHNHPTEIEPFGGAATCIGGAIRDPLSGRAYVYQAMRVTGSGDPRTPVGETLPGKLPQRKITLGAARGFSSYGNQIGIATGCVREFYHPGYIAKRLETGAVIGAAPAKNVTRSAPKAGDAVVLLGGRTGRDGIGGAAGSSKTHDLKTVTESAAEVQKGNAPEERKLQRLFSNPRFTALVKRCNDFGAGGVAVAAGELADGLEIDLDAIPVKYYGLTATELAISESQERMAVVVESGSLPALFSAAESENIEATVIARVTSAKRLVIKWHGQIAANIARDFLNTNGPRRLANAVISDYANNKTAKSDLPFEKKLSLLLGDINFCSQKGLVERFDASIGAGSVFMPFGGKYALTESQVMAAKLPKKGAQTATVMAYGFDPVFAESDPFAAAAYAVVTSAAKLVSAGARLDTVHLTLQEYFPRADGNAQKWGASLAALIGAFSAQMGLKIAAVGGKDSCSGSFGELDVPPALISFAVGICRAETLISAEFKEASHPVYILKTPQNDDGLPDYAALLENWKRYAALCEEGVVAASAASCNYGILGSVIQMCLGNMLGFSVDTSADLFERQWGSIIFETIRETNGFELLGCTKKEPALFAGGVRRSLEGIRAAWEAPLESVFPVNAAQSGEAPRASCEKRPRLCGKAQIARPVAVIPVFPGTNCEYDTAAALERAGGAAREVLIRNLTPRALQESAAELESAVKQAQMLILPGGFSGGDEPDGSAKFIVSLFSNPNLKEAVSELISLKDGLILGICNGFQALVKLGLLPYGKIAPATESSPTLTYNQIGRHQSRYVNCCVSSVISPWLGKCAVGDVFTQPVSHGEGRFTATDEVLKALSENGQIAFQYVDGGGTPSMNVAYNPNGSAWAIESITSPDGRVLGKMAHTERQGDFVAKNIPGNKFLPLFEGGVRYFK